VAGQKRQVKWLGFIADDRPSFPHFNQINLQPVCETKHFQFWPDWKTFANQTMPQSREHKGSVRKVMKHSSGRQLKCLSSSTQIQLPKRKSDAMHLHCASQQRWANSRTGWCFLKNNVRVLQVIKWVLPVDTTCSSF